MIYFRSFPAMWKYKYNNPDTLIFIGKLDFNISKSSPLNLSYTSTRSNCYTINNIDVEKNVKPFNYTLEAYPNPFNPTVNITYSVPSSSNVKIDIYDTLIKLIKNIYDGYKTSGKYEIMFNSKCLSSGVYFCKLEINNNLIKTVKIILSK